MLDRFSCQIYLLSSVACLCFGFLNEFVRLYRVLNGSSVCPTYRFLSIGCLLWPGIQRFLPDVCQGGSRNLSAGNCILFVIFTT